MPVTITDIGYIARCARLSFLDTATAILTSPLNRCLAFMDHINLIATTTTASLMPAIELQNAVRADVRHPGLSREEPLQDAPTTMNTPFTAVEVIGDR